MSRREEGEEDNMGGEEMEIEEEEEDIQKTKNEGGVNRIWNQHKNKSQ